MGTKLKWNDKVAEAFYPEIDRRFGKAIGQLTSYTRMQLSRSQPIRTLADGTKIGLNPSKPGQYPKMVTKKLRNSIKHKNATSGTKIEHIMYTKDKKARQVEHGTRKTAARPFFARSVTAMIPAMKRRLEKPNA